MEFDREWIEGEIANIKPGASLPAYRIDQMMERRTALKEVLDHHTPKKKVDISKLPVDTLVEVRDSDDEKWTKRYFQQYGSRLNVFVSGSTSQTAISAKTYSQLRLIEQEKFTFWQGGECPVPDGVRLEIIFRSGKSTAHDKPLKLHWGNIGDKSDVIAYRILGIADGWQI